MIQKQSFNAIKGMRQDVSPSKANPEYIFDAKNIRLTARGNDTLLSISNEQGTTPVINIGGRVLGYCVLNKYIVLFTRSSSRYRVENDEIVISYSNTILRVYKKDNNEFISEVLYSGSDLDNKYLNLGDNIQTLGIYENENIQKVYWVDGVNQPRVINIVKDWLENTSVEEIANSYTNTSFDFVPELQLKEDIKVKTILGGNGRFSSGTIQYAFTYYNKYGQESNIFYTTDLNYVTYSDRGGSAEDKPSVSFEITINKLDQNFDYVRIYSIHRTSINATPEVKRVVDLPAFSQNITESKYIYYTKVTNSNTIKVNGNPLSQFDQYIKNIVWEDEQLRYENGNYYEFDKSILPDITITTDDAIITYGDSSNYIYISKNKTSTPISPEGILINGGGNQIKIQQTVKSANNIIFIDNNTTGESVDPTFLLYVGGEDIIASSLTQKDNTLFLGNITLNRNLISKTIKDSLLALTIKQNTRDITTIGQIGTYYSYSNQLVAGNTTTFKIGEHYRLGIQFQYKNGKWSEPIPINYDYTVTPKYNNINCRPSTSIENGNIKYSLPYLYISLDSDIQNSLINNGYKKVRTVVVNPSLQDRKVILQGIVCPTVYTIHNRGIDIHGQPYTDSMGDIYAQSSWFFRPFHTGTNDPEEYRNSNAGGYLQYTHNAPINCLRQAGGKFASYDDYDNLANICGAEIEYAGGEVTEDSKKWFRVDQTFLNLYSPDIEFDTSIQQLDSQKFVFKKVGRVNFDASVGDINIQTSSPTIGPKAKGFVHKTTNFIWDEHHSNNGAKSLVSNLFYADYVVDETGDGVFSPLTSRGSAEFLVCPWQSSGSLNNDINRPANAGTRSAVLKRKVISNLKISFNNTWKDTTTADTYSDIQIGVFNSNEVSLLKYKGKNYLGNIDTLLTYENTYSKVARLLSEGAYRIKTIKEAYGEDGSVGDKYEDLLEYSPTIRIKYKTAPHIVFQLDNPLQSDTNLKPHLYLMDICRDTVDNPFGGTSDAALKANQWIPSGPAVPLSSTNNTVVQFLHGDCWYQRYDCLKTYPFTNEDENSIVEIGSFMVETRVNIDGRYDRNRGLSSNLNITPQNFNLLNNIYTQQDNFFNYRTLDKDFYKLNSFPNTITWSKEKSSGEDVDTWTNITMANTFDVDGNLGQVQSIENYNNELYCFQDKGISRILFNNRVQIPTGDNIPIEISNGYKVQGKVYLSNTVGCQNQKAIKVTPNGIYFSDLNNSGIYLLNQQGMQDISTPRGFTNWVKEYQPNRIFYDKNNGDLYFMNNREEYSYKDCLCFSEKINEFTSFMDYNKANFMFNLENEFYSVCLTSASDRGQISTLYKMFDGDYNNFFGETKPYHITYVANQNPTNDKIFNTIEFRGDSLNTNDKLIKGTDTKMPNICPFSKLTVWNEYQRGEETLNRIYGRPSNLKEKFRTWRANIPRDESNHRDRIRNPWAYIKLEGSNNTNRMQLHDLQVYYFDNSIIPQR